jgi:hypothetical protein
MERKTNAVAGYSLFARTFVCVENRLITELLYADCSIQNEKGWNFTRFAISWKEIMALNHSLPTVEERPGRSKSFREEVNPKP